MAMAVQVRHADDHDCHDGRQSFEPRRIPAQPDIRENGGNIEKQRKIYPSRQVGAVVVMKIANQKGAEQGDGNEPAYKIREEASGLAKDQ